MRFAKNKNVNQDSIPKKIEFSPKSTNSTQIAENKNNKLLYLNNENKISLNSTFKRIKRSDPDENKYETNHSLESFNDKIEDITIIKESNKKLLQKRCPNIKIKQEGNLKSQKMKNTLCSKLSEKYNNITFWESKPDLKKYLEPFLNENKNFRERFKTFKFNDNIYIKNPLKKMFDLIKIQDFNKLISLKQEISEMPALYKQIGFSHKYYSLFQVKSGKISKLCSKYKITNEELSLYDQLDHFEDSSDDDFDSEIDTCDEN